MRSLNIAMVLPFLVASVGLAGCAAPAADDNADGQSNAVTGGSGAIESPVVFLFESAAKDIAPKCAGAMIADKFAVTAASCAKVGLILGHAAEARRTLDETDSELGHAPDPTGRAEFGKRYGRRGPGPGPLPHSDLCAVPAWRA